MSDPSITVAICSHNRHQYLLDCLESLRGQTLASDRFKVLIVDNSTDLDAAAKFYEQTPLRGNEAVDFLSPPGLSRARNHAAKTCGTPYVAFLDDDARASPTWLAAVLHCFLADSRVTGVGGPIAPIWVQPPPAWLPVRHIAMLTIVGEEGGDRSLTPRQYLFGANMAFAVEALIEAGGFPEQVGRIGEHTLISCDETQIQDHMRASGGTIRFVTGAKVHHIVHPDRLSRHWMRSRMAWESVSAHLQVPPDFNPESSAYQLKELCKRRPEMIQVVRAIFDDTASEAFDDQLDLIRHSTGLLLATKKAETLISGLLNKVGTGQATELQKRIGALEKELLAKSDELLALRRAKEEAGLTFEHTRARLRAIEGSTAWKATSPARWLVEFLRSRSRALREKVRAILGNSDGH